MGLCRYGINYTILDDTNVNSILSELETPCFGFDKKLIIVKNCNLFKKSKSIKSKQDNDGTISFKLAEYIENNINVISKTTILVIIEETVEKCKLYEVLEKNNVVICEFKKLKIDEIILRLKKICSLYKVDIDKSTLEYFVQTSGMSMETLINEIRKLIEYVGENGKITNKEIDLLAIPEVNNIIFNLTDSLGEKNIKKALNIFYDLIYMKEALQSIMINLYRHFKKLYLYKLAEEGNYNIIEVLELSPKQQFLISKYKRQAGFFKKNELKNILYNFMKLDENYKKGNIDLQIGLELILVESSLAN